MTDSIAERFESCSWYRDRQYKNDFTVEDTHNHRMPVNLHVAEHLESGYATEAGKQVQLCHKTGGNMTDLDRMVDDMTDEVYQRLVSAVELGKWQDGRRLSSLQKDLTLQLVMLYQARHLDQHDHLTVNNRGEINEYTKMQFKRLFEGNVIITDKN